DRHRIEDDAGGVFQVNGFGPQQVRHRLVLPALLVQVALPALIAERHRDLHAAIAGASLLDLLLAPLLGRRRLSPAVPLPAEAALVRPAGQASRAASCAGLAEA